jgi:hypothetical protein
VLLGALAGLSLHALLDGAALSSPGPEGGVSLLALGVILHRLPDALAVWLIVRSLQGPRWAAGLLGLMGVATVAGYLLGERALDALPPAAVAVFEALVAGSLLHILLHHPAGSPVDADAHHEHHHHHPDVAEGRRQLGGTAGSLAAVALLVALERTQGGRFGDILRSLSLVSLPWAAAGLVLAGVLAACGGPRRAGLGRGLLAGAARAADGARALAVYRERAAAPLTAAATVAAMLTLGVDGVLVSLPLLGPGLAGVRLGGALAVAVVAALAAGAVARPAEAAEADEPLTVRGGLAAAADHVLPWLGVGLLGGALLAEHLTPGVLSVAAVPATVLAAVAGLPVNLPVVALAPAAAVLLAGGLPTGVVLAFLLAAPAAGWRLLRGIAQVHGPASAVAYALAVAGVSAAVGLLVGGARPGVAMPAAPLAAAWGGALLAAALALDSLLRRGPRGLIEQALHAPDEDAH